MFFGDYIRQLTDQQDLHGDQVRGAFLNILTGLGVVGALMLSLTLDKADASTDVDYFALFASCSWYGATVSSAFVCGGSTLFAILLSVTPADDVVALIRKLMYLFMLPSFGILAAFECLFFGVSKAGGYVGDGRACSFK